MANIIIVEDDLTLANIYKKSLEEGGHIAELVSDVEAVNTIKAKKPQLVLLDILMPNVNGLDILRELKADPLNADIPVLMLTNVAENESIAKGLEYGALGYLLKSETTPNLILSRVNRTLEETSPPTV
jgi:CheY-like chemotaxis protein